MFGFLIVCEGIFGLAALVARLCGKTDEATFFLVGVVWAVAQQVYMMLQERRP